MYFRVGEARTTSLLSSVHKQAHKQTAVCELHMQLVPSANSFVLCFPLYSTFLKTEACMIPTCSWYPAQNSLSFNFFSYRQ